MPRWIPPLFASTVFLSAFLLFVLQPIAAKQLLPQFGGSSAVWTTSLLLFTAFLFFGYLYVFLLTRLPQKTQVYLHSGFLAISVMFVALFRAGAVFSMGSGSPFLDVFAALALSIGIPYVLLSTTGPLLQYWYGSWSGREPYALYAMSNAGSLIALIGYPFVIEPMLSMHIQQWLWVALFLLYIVSVATLAYIVYRSPVSSVGETQNPLPRLRASSWLALAALPAGMLVASTTAITEAIAPVPLLWTLPLLLYIVSFILAFRGWGSGIFTPLFLTLSAVAAYYAALLPSQYPRYFGYQVLCALALLFFCSLLCHARLYALRPDTARSPLFYLLISLGGALGTLIVTLGAPLVFTDFLEFPLGIALCASFGVVILSPQFFPRIMSERGIRFFRAGSLALIVLLFVGFVQRDDGVPNIATRNFYGTAKVLFYPSVTALKHGSTIHGMQMASSSARLPIGYYSASSGAGRALTYARQERGSLRVGVLGLGTGTLAAYCETGDDFVFYEIDPRIEGLARTYFSYLSHCDGSKVREGDGRLLLENELRSGSNEFDVLAVDAFSDDRIPMHLLTKQAFDIYTAHLRSDDSILAVHVSNRYLYLPPVILRIAREIGYSGMLVEDAGESSEGASPSLWVLLAKDPNVFRSVIFAHSNSAPPSSTAAPLWTDDYASILSALNLGLFAE